MKRNSWEYFTPPQFVIWPICGVSSDWSEKQLVSRKRTLPKKHSGANSPPRGTASHIYPKWHDLPLPALLALSAAFFLTVYGNLHSSWAWIPWLVGIAIWLPYFRARQADLPLATTERNQFPYGQLALVVAAAASARLYKISELPLGPYSDEIFTLTNSLALVHRSWDFFGHTPLFTVGWVETANLYLYFNLLILKVFGVSYWSMKLFSIIPGIIACGSVFVMARLLFSPRVALGTALLFALAHWPVRLSRYGWDVSFMIMTFSMTTWLLLLAVRRDRRLFAYLAGVASGVGLYSYLGARVCLLSVLFWLALEFALRREQSICRHGRAFFFGATMTAYPLLLYYVEKPGVFAVRTAELTVFNSANPLAQIVDNIWRHALMFFIQGGAYARDNFPGLPMLDPITGFLLLVGVFFLFREFKNPGARLIACTFIVNFASGVFSISQEGAPYVYRTAAVIIPAFLIIGHALHRVLEFVDRQPRKSSAAKLLTPAYAFVLLSIVSLNYYYYFGLEPTNTAATRVTAYEARILGQEIAGAPLPVILIGRDMLHQPAAKPNSGEKFAYANPPLILPAEMRLLAIIAFSGRYDTSQTVTANLERPKNIYLADTDFLAANKPRLPLPVKLVFRSDNRQLWDTIQSNYPTASRRDIRNIHGEPLFTVATLPNPVTTPAETPANQQP